MTRWVVCRLPSMHNKSWKTPGLNCPLDGEAYAPSFKQWGLTSRTALDFGGQQVSPGAIVKLFAKRTDGGPERVGGA